MAAITELEEDGLPRHLSVKVKVAGMTMTIPCGRGQQDIRWLATVAARRFSALHRPGGRSRTVSRTKPASSKLTLPFNVRRKTISVSFSSVQGDSCRFPATAVVTPLPIARYCPFLRDVGFHVCFPPSICPSVPHFFRRLILMWLGLLSLCVVCWWSCGSRRPRGYVSLKKSGDRKGDAGVIRRALEDIHVKEHVVVMVSLLYAVVCSLFPW
jgi:hypothetical protein